MSNSVPAWKRPPTRSNGDHLQGLIWMEWLSQAVLALLTSLSLLITLALIGVLLYETWQFFQQVPIARFFTDTEWTPLFAQKRYGILVLASGTFMVTAIALALAIPVGLLVAVYLSEYAPANQRTLFKPTLDALAGIPTVILGYFALLFVTPLLKQVIPGLGVFNSLSAGLVTGMMILPIISSLSEDALRNVSPHLREGASALGFTKHEGIVKVVLPTALPGIMAAVALAASRALGETMIAAIAAGQTPVLTLNPLVPVSTMTGFMIQVSQGNVAFGSLAFHTLFTVGTMLFVVSLGLNTLSYWLVRRYRRLNAGVTVAGGGTLESAATKPAEARSPLEWNPLLFQRFAPNFDFRQHLDQGFKTLALVASLVGLVILALLLLNALHGGAARLNWQFLTSLAARKAQETGILSALVGTLWLLGLTTLFVLPLGIGGAIYLEEYLPDNLLSQVIEINIANLAAVPSIIYGLLGLELFVRLGKPLTGGPSILSGALTLTVIVLPLLIIATRTALRSVPDDLRQAGYAVGMSRWQVLLRVVLPAAFPSILSGALLTLTVAAGETAALIAVGALAFVPFIPPLSWAALQSQYIALPVQIFDWVSRPQAAFHANAAAAIIVMIGLLVLLNLAAVLVPFLTKRREN